MGLVYLITIGFVIVIMAYQIATSVGPRALAPAEFLEPQHALPPVERRRDLGDLSPGLAALVREARITRLALVGPLGEAASLARRGWVFVALANTGRFNSSNTFGEALAREENALIEIDRQILELGLVVARLTELEQQTLEERGVDLAALEHLLSGKPLTAKRSSGLPPPSSVHEARQTVERCTQLLRRLERIERELLTERSRVYR